MKLSCVVLTVGNRPTELRHAIESVLDQDLGHAGGSVDCSGGEPVEIVVVGNGAPVPELPPEVKTLELPTNVGIPAGRNRGVEATSGDVVLFLDDDGWYPSKQLAAHVRDAFAADPKLGVLSFRVSDPEGGPGARRHVPRLRAGDPLRSSEVTSFLGGACAVRRGAFDVVGGLPASFFYAHEETDFAWRAIDEGYRIRYDADAVMCHPAVTPTWHADFYRLNARNRVWLARRNLPWPLAACYLGAWMALTVLRERGPRTLRVWLGGFAEGWRESPGERDPISWRAVWEMTKAGRPPVI